MPEYRNIGDLLADVLGQIQPGIIAGQQQKQAKDTYLAEQARTSKETAFKRYLEMQKLGIDQSRLGLEAGKTDKPLKLDELIGREAQKGLEAGTLTLDGLIELKRKMSSKSGSSDLLNRQTLSKAQNAFLEGRAKVPEEYETEDAYGGTISKVRFNESPFTAGTLDTLTAIGQGQFPAAQPGDTTRTPKPFGTQTIQGLPPMYDEKTKAAIQSLRLEYPDFDSAPREVQQAAIRKRLSGL